MSIKSMLELEDEYKRFVAVQQSRTLDLSQWLPAFKGAIRRVKPGELVVIMADTGHGKTAILQNIAVSCRDGLIFCMFELELPGTACFERFMAISNDMPQWAVEQAYTNGEIVRTGPCDHIYTCDAARVKPTDIERLIAQSGRTFDVIMVDYIGLMGGNASKSRYERVSQNAEELKRVARNTDSVLIVSSQVKRKPDFDEEEGFGLHDAKDSGSIENSAQLVLSAWRCGEQNKEMRVRIVKGTGGGSGTTIACNFYGDTLKIEQAICQKYVRAPYAD